MAKVTSSEMGVLPADLAVNQRVLASSEGETYTTLRLRRRGDHSRVRGAFVLPRPSSPVVVTTATTISKGSGGQ